MTTTEVDAVFQTHADYMTQSRLLPLAPLVQNVDLPRIEYRPEGNIEPSTRDWAASLKTATGINLQCYADNGGDSRRAQLIVPLSNLAAVRSEPLAYEKFISPFNQRETQFTSLVQQAHPLEIYVPTTAIHNNLAFIQQLSPSTV